MRTDFLGKLLMFAVTAVLLVVAFMFSMVVLVFVVTAGLLVYGYLWWKTRDLRKQMREHAREQPPGEAGGSPGGYVIEGEVIHEHTTIESHDPEQR